MCKRVSITHDLEIWSKKAESNTKSQNHVSNNLAGMTSTHPTHLHNVLSNWGHSTFSFYCRQGPWLSWAGLTRFTRVEYSAEMWMCLAEIHLGCWSGGLTFQDVRATCSALPCMLLQRSMEPKCIWLSQEDCTRMSRTSWIWSRNNTKSPASVGVDIFLPLVGLHESWAFHAWRWTLATLYACHIASWKDL